MQEQIKEKTYHKKYSDLTELIHALTENSSCRICVQNIDGYFEPIISSLPYEYRYHVGSICELSKSNRRGMGICAKCKYRTIDLALRKDKMWIGACVWGIYEVVQPIYHEGRLSCMIYIGNLLVNEDLFDNNCKQNSAIINIPYENFLNLKEKLLRIQNHDFSPYIRCAKLIKSYIELLSNVMPREKPRDQTNEIVRSALKYAADNYMEPLTIGFMARSCYVSENYYGKVFKRETGMTFAEYLNQIRIVRAADFLLSSSDNIIDISERCGYENVTYFNRVFKRLTGKTPTAFRQNPDEGSRWLDMFS